MKTQIRNILIVILVFMFFQTQVVYGQNDDISIYVEGSLIEDINPIIKEGRTFVPVRDISEALDGIVEYEPEEKKVIIEREGYKVVLRNGHKIAIVDEYEKELDVEPFIYKDKTYVPLRFISENLRENVEWVKEERIVLIGEYMSYDYPFDSKPYYGERDKWKLQIPNSWKDKVFIEEEENKIKLHHTKSAEMFKKEGYKRSAPIVEIMKNDKPYTKTRTTMDEYLMKYLDGEFIEAYFVHDFQFYPETQEEYLKLQEEAKEIIKTFQVYDDKSIMKDYGFKIEIPNSWDDNLLIQRGENRVNFLHKSNETGPGFLFAIERLKGTLWTEEDILEVPIPQRLLKKGNGWTYVETLPSGLEYDPANEKDSKEYMEMRKDIPKINNNIELIETKSPTSNKKGNVHVGSAFFETSIPKNWTIEKSKDNEFAWNILDSKNKIGKIELVEDKSDKKESDMDIKYIEDKQMKRILKVSIKNEFKDHLGKVELTGNTWTSMDFKKHLEEYVKGGGTKITGKIINYELLEDKNRIKKLTIKDEEGNKKEMVNDYSNIVLLKDGKETLYGVEFLSKDFIDKIKDFEDRIFEVIVSKDGEIKGIWEKLNN